MPALNEAGCIRRAVLEVQHALAELTDTYEILVVDDGSTDETPRILGELMERDKIRVLRADRNRGYGWAIRAGVAMAEHPIVFLTDSDCQFDPAEVRQLFAELPFADLIIGERSNRQDGASRSALSAGYNAIVRWLFDITVPDVNCAFKLFYRDMFLALGLVSERYCINTEMLARAVRAGKRIKSVPVTHRPRTTGVSKVNIFDIPSSLLELRQVRRDLRRGPSYQTPVAASR